MYRIKIIYLLLFIPVFFSCRKYVENVPVQGQRVLVYTDEYRMLMNNSDDQQLAYGLGPVISCDDLDLTETVLTDRLKTNTIQSAMYTWSKPFYIDKQADYDWNKSYNNIYTFNVVIDGVHGSKGGSDALKNALLAEALIGRAYCYFMLCNQYAKQYDAATSATDPGVPLLQHPELFTNLTRTPVQKVYESILSDIRQAIPIIPVKQDINFRPNKAAAYAMLSKVHLFMRNFNDAKAFADSSLALAGELYDLNNAISGPSPLPPAQYNDKQVLMRRIPRLSFNWPQLSASLLALLDTKDIRYTLYVRNGNSGFNPSFNGMGFWPRDRYSSYNDVPAGLSVNETWLIKAECLAREGSTDAAVTMLNDFRKKRFKPADYTPLQAASKEEALQLVVDERRREFFGSGLRWFDQKRLNKDPQFAKSVTRVFNGLTYTLEPNSNAYVFPLAMILIGQNPEMVQNPN